MPKEVIFFLLEMCDSKVKEFLFKRTLHHGYSASKENKLHIYRFCEKSLAVTIVYFAEKKREKDLAKCLRISQLKKNHCSLNMNR